MRTTAILRALVLTAGLAAAAAAHAQPTFTPSFTYQGQLQDGGGLAHGTYQMVFNLFDAPTGGTLVDKVGTTAVPVSMLVSGGLFSQELLFLSPQAFNGQDRWLEILVRPLGGTSFTALTPRQKITAAPFAIQTRGLQTSTTGQGHFVRLGPGTPAGQINGLEFGAGTTAAWSFAREANNVLAVRAGGADAGPRVMTFHANGNVGVGLGVPTAPLQVFGRAKVNSLEIVGGADIAEPFPIAGDVVRPGMIVSIDAEALGGLRIASTAYDTAVAGIISGAGGVNTGMVLRQEGTIADGQHPVALSGRVWCLVDAEAGGPIRPGDLVTSSDTPGHGMKAADTDRRAGAVIGKAMSSLESGRGLVLVLVNLQ